MAGFIVLLSLLLTWLHSAFWLLLNAFVGVNLIQAAFTGFCPAAVVARRLGIKSGQAFD